MKGKTIAILAVGSVAVGAYLLYVNMPVSREWKKQIRLIPGKTYSVKFNKLIGKSPPMSEAVFKFFQAGSAVSKSGEDAAYDRIDYNGPERVIDVPHEIPIEDKRLEGESLQIIEIREHGFHLLPVE